jgi:hypothetical protein
MHGLPKPVDDPAMRKLVALVQEQLPNSAHQARIYLLKQLHALEQEALETGADPARCSRSVLRRASSGEATR